MTTEGVLVVPVRMMVIVRTFALCVAEGEGASERVFPIDALSVAGPSGLGRPG